MFRILAGLFCCLLLLFSNRLSAQSLLSEDSTYQSVREIQNDSARLNKALDYFAELSLTKPLVARELKDSILAYHLNIRRKTDEISRQQQVIMANEKVRLLLIAMLTMVIFLAVVSFYSYRKADKLNRLISAQKHEVELIGQVKDRIFSVVSHDMRSPVNTLIAFTQLLEHDDVTPEQLASYTAQIKQSLTYTSVLIENLLNWASSQMQGFKPFIEIFDINLIAGEAINSLQQQSSVKKIAIDNSIPSGMLVSADINMTQLVLRNLISNAIKYSHANSRIRLNATAVEDKVNLVVQDEGTGMPDQIIEQFNNNNYLHFLESTPGTNKEKGTGLGLVLCKNFTTLMGGQISVTSRPGKGSLFSVTLPKGTA